MTDETYCEDMLFNYETSHRTYYRDREIKPIVTTTYRSKPTCCRVRPPPLRDIHTLVDWKEAKVPPFNLYHRRKEVVRTNPRDMQQYYETPIDIDLEHAQKTRPRVVITPAVSLDDVPPEHRKVLIDEVYTTAARRAARVASSAVARAPLPTTPAAANPFLLPRLAPPPVPAEWRLSSAAWDARQLRGHCDPARELYDAKAAAHTAADETGINLGNK